MVCMWTVKLQIYMKLSMRALCLSIAVLKVTGKEVKKDKLVFLSFFASIHPPGFQTHSPRHGVLNWFVNVS